MNILVVIWLIIGLVESIKLKLGKESEMVKDMDMLEYLYFKIKHGYQITVLFIWFAFYATLDYFNIYTLQIQKPIAEETYSVKPSNYFGL